MFSGTLILFEGFILHCVKVNSVKYVKLFYAQLWTLETRQIWNVSPAAVIRRTKNLVLCQILIYRSLSKHFSYSGFLVFCKEVIRL